jgi:hypothetical protein
MSARLWLFAPVLLVAGILMTGADEPTALAAGPPAPAQGSSTLDDQTELALTVYNSNIALVRDVRTLQLPRGTFDLQFMDIAATVNPATVHFRSLTEPGRVSVLEQNYEYDLLEPDRSLEGQLARGSGLAPQAPEEGHDTEFFVCRDEIHPAVKSLVASVTNIVTRNVSTVKPKIRAPLLPL